MTFFGSGIDEKYDYDPEEPGFPALALEALDHRLKSSRLRKSTKVPFAYDLGAAGVYYFAYFALPASFVRIVRINDAGAQIGAS